MPGRHDTRRRRMQAQQQAFSSAIGCASGGVWWRAPQQRGVDHNGDVRHERGRHVRRDLLHLLRGAGMHWDPCEQLAVLAEGPGGPAARRGSASRGPGRSGACSCRSRCRDGSRRLAAARRFWFVGNCCPDRRHDNRSRIAAGDTQPVDGSVRRCGPVRDVARAFLQLCSVSRATPRTPES